MNPSAVPAKNNSARPITHNEFISVFIVAKRNIYVDGLVRVISELQDHKVIACVAPEKDCYTKFSNNPADILLVEESVVVSHLQETSVDELFKEFKQHFPELRIVIFGRELDDTFIRKMIRAGAHGFIDSTMTQETLQHALKEVHSGGYWVSRKALEQLIFSAVEMERIVEQGIRDKVETFQKNLTSRETDVLHHVLEGMSTREIADSLCLSEQSVKLHLSRLFKKFEVTNRSQLILMAFARVCPVNNMIHLFRNGIDKQRIARGYDPLINDPLSAPG